MTLVASPVLVGRDTELRTLLRAITRPPAVALVEGEAGIGKTRLVKAAVDRLGGGERIVLLGHCHQIREAFPYGPVFDALRNAADALPESNRLNPVVGALRGHLPELARGLPPSPAPLDDPLAERHRLFRAVHALLEAVSPAVLVIEDLHWADDGTRDLLRFLIGQPPDGLALVTTYRRSDLPVPELPLGRAHRRLPGTTSEVISLTPLDAESVRSLAGALLGRADVTSAFAARLLDRTAGIPFVIEEVVRSLPGADGRRTDDDGEPDALEHITVPVLLREAMADRLSDLSPAGLNAVYAAAALRLPATEPLIAAVTGQSTGPGPLLGASQAAAGIREALRAGVLHEDGDGRYGFRHVLAQQAVYDVIPGPDRRRAHMRAMAALAALDSPPLVQLAFHARRAGDIEAWRRYGAAAADHAAALGDSPLAVEVLEGMLGDPDLPRSCRGPLMLRLSKVAAIGLSHRRVVRLLRRLLSDDFLSREVRGEVRLNLGVLMSNQAGAIAAGRQEIIAALNDLDDRPATAARGLALLAMPAWGDEPLTTHMEWMDRAERLLAVVNDPEVTAAVQANRVAFAMLVGSPDAFTLAATLPVNDPSAAVRRQAARAYSNLCDGAIPLGHYAAAERFAQEGRRLAKETGALYSGYLVEVSSVRLDWLTGRWDGLRRRAAAVVEMTPEAPLLAADAQLVLGMLALVAGEWEEAASYLHAAGLRHPGSGFHPVLAAASGGVIELHLARGSVDAAVSEADRALSRLRRKGVWVWGAHLVPSAVAALLTAGRFGDAATLVSDFADSIKDRSAPSAEAALDMARGMTAQAEGRHEAAAEFLARSRAAQAAMPQPYGAARAAEAEAGARLRLGDRAAAGEILTDAAERFTGLGATHDAARCRRTLRDIGAGSLPRGARKAKGGVLSTRESEVARLVALGRTNREIAEVLFLSPRTVETHVAKVLRKLGVRSRNDVAPPR
ncbi:AAA family ATPase [Streptosporangium sp. NPDC001681]|uniref:helix-turn-helix transcriptional regulator n=1 Tax=Streptosporangium sp. NPDC001681 TaxID=3154395 RepID=UPI0033180D34